MSGLVVYRLGVGVIEVRVVACRRGGARDRNGEVACMLLSLLQHFICDRVLNVTAVAKALVQSPTLFQNAAVISVIGPHVAHPALGASDLF